MNDVPCLSLEEAEEHYRNKTALFVDVRDPDSNAESHIPEAFALTNENVETFVGDTQKDQAIVVYCYHGNSSKGVTAYLQEQGFSQVWSMNEGFEGWRGKYETTNNQ